jgi:hypothetical protein
MSDRRILLFALALFARPLVAQDDIALLRRRVANIEAHRVVLARAVAQHDSAVLAAQSLRVVGSAPIQVAVPGAAVPGATEALARIVTEQRARFGSLLDRLPPETLTVAFDPAATQDDGEKLVDTPARLVDRLQWVVGNWIHARVVGELPNGLYSWMGGQLPAVNGEGQRTRALTILLSDSTGHGVRCLEGELTTCRVLLASGARGNAILALSLAGSVVERGGAESWGRMAGERTIDEALVSGAAAPMDTVIARWVEALHTRGVDSATPFGMLLGSALVWAVLLAALFLWRVKWHHA